MMRSRDAANSAAGDGARQVRAKPNEPEQPAEIKEIPVW